MPGTDFLCLSSICGLIIGPIIGRKFSFPHTLPDQRIRNPDSLLTRIHRLGQTIPSTSCHLKATGSEAAFLRWKSIRNLSLQPLSHVLV